MSAFQSKSQLFGLDLSPLWRDLVSAWRGMLAWSVLAWFGPKLRVRLWLPTGHAVSSCGPGTPHRANDKRLNTARFNAVLLPEHLLLRSVLNLPRLASHEMSGALTLHITSLSPFRADDLVWTHEVAPPRTGEPGAVIPVHLALTSRKLVASHLVQAHPDINAAATEVWLPSALSPSDVLLPGFGEAVRLRQLALWRWASALLVLCVLALLAAMGMTATAQLYIRTLQAQTVMTALKQKAAPVLQQREALMHATDQLVNLAELTGKPMPPLHMLKLISDALPDDTSLLSLQTQGPKVSITGQTTDTTALMKLLSATPGLREVTAPTPATKPLGAPRESFTIEFTLDATQPMPASSQPTAPTPAK